MKTVSGKVVKHSLA